VRPQGCSKLRIRAPRRSREDARGSPGRVAVCGSSGWLISSEKMLTWSDRQPKPVRLLCGAWAPRDGRRACSRRCPDGRPSEDAPRRWPAGDRVRPRRGERARGGGRRWRGPPIGATIRADGRCGSPATAEVHAASLAGSTRTRRYRRGGAREGSDQRDVPDLDGAGERGVGVVCASDRGSPPGSSVAAPAPDINRRAEPTPSTREHEAAVDRGVSGHHGSRRRSPSRGRQGAAARQSWVSRRLMLAERLERALQDDIRLGLLSPTVARTRAVAARQPGADGGALFQLGLCGPA